jgi:hypothetical protein
MFYTDQGCKGFVGYDDADPSSVSPLIYGTEMRVAETRAVWMRRARHTRGANPRKPL